MPSADLVRFLAAAKDDPELRSALTTATSPDEVLRIAADRGITLTAADLTFVNDAGGVEVSDEDLASFTGGNAWLTDAEFCSTSGMHCTLAYFLCG